MKLFKLIINRLRLDRWTAAVLFMLLGSFAHINNESLAVGTIVAAIIGPFLALRFCLRRESTNADRFQFSVLATLFVISLVATSIFPTIDNARYLKAFFFNFMAFSVMAYCIKYRSRSAAAGVFYFAIIIGAVAALQISYLLLGVGLDPTRSDATDYAAMDAFTFAGVRSIFANPNDFSVVSTLLLIFALYGTELNRRVRGITAAILFSMAIFAGSRTGLVVTTLVLVTYYTTGIRQTVTFALVAATAIGVIFLSLIVTGKELSDSYWGNKALTITSMLNTGSAHSISDESVQLRWAEYAHVLSNLGSLGLGSFKAQHYNHLVTGNELFSKNPHSLMNELALLFGFIGLFAFFAIFYWLLASFRRAKLGVIRRIALLLSIFMLTFVSSSVINFPAFWVMVFAVAMGARSETHLPHSMLRVRRSHCRHPISYQQTTT